MTNELKGSCLRLCKPVADEIERLQAEIERLTTMNSELNIGIKKLKEFAIKEFAERLCEDRVSNDPVVIAVRAELKNTTEPVKLEHTSLCETETYMGE